MKKSKYIWFNGKFVPWDNAKTHVLSHGLHYGSGIFEGIRAYSDKDKNAYNIAKRRAEEAQRQRDEIRGASREINNLKCEMHEIKSMLKTLLDKN